MKDRVKELELANKQISKLLPNRDSLLPFQAKISAYIKELKVSNQCLRLTDSVVESAIDKIAHLDSNQTHSDRLRFDRLTNAIKASVHLSQEITRLNLLLVAQGASTEDLTKPELTSWHNTHLDATLLKTNSDLFV